MSQTFVDRPQVGRRFARVAASYDKADFFAREVDGRMLERLDYVKIEPQRIVDLGLTGRQAWVRARAAYEKLRRDGKLPATFEVIYGHAWKTQPKKIDDGRAIIRFDKPPRK